MSPPWKTGCAQKQGCTTLWKVKLKGRARAVQVTADYHVIEQGALRFRSPQARGYPINLMTFAPGEWLSVENMGFVPVAGEPLP